MASDMGVLDRLKMNVCVQLGIFDLGLYLKLLSKLKLARDRHIGRRGAQGLLKSLTELQLYPLHFSIQREKNMKQILNTMDLGTGYKIFIIPYNFKYVKILQIL